MMVTEEAAGGGERPADRRGWRREGSVGGNEREIGEMSGGGGVMLLALMQ